MVQINIKIIIYDHTDGHFPPILYYEKQCSNAYCHTYILLQLRNTFSGIFLKENFFHRLLMHSIVSLQNSCLIPNSKYLSIWLYLEIGSLARDQLR